MQKRAFDNTCQLFNGRFLVEKEVACYALLRNCMIIKKRIELQIMNLRFLWGKEIKKVKMKWAFLYHQNQILFE